MLSIAYALTRNLFGFVQSIPITFKCWLATFFGYKELFESTEIELIIWPNFDLFALWFYPALCAFRWNLRKLNVV